MATNGGAFPPIVAADDHGRGCAPAAGGARQGERSLDPKRAGVQRHPSGLQNDPDDSVHSGGSNMGSTGQNEATKSHLSNSVYAWACGEKAEGEREEPKTSDAVIGWMILLSQALAYGFIIHKAKSASDDDGEEAESSSSSSPSLDASDGTEPAYSFSSVAAAMYLLVATATPDLRSGFALLVDGTSSARHKVFGVALLGVFGLMITAAMELLSSEASNDVGIVADSVTVLFIADVDEKALTFFLTVPQEWRLFWVMNMISLSFSLALIFVVYVGGGEALYEEEVVDPGEAESLSIDVNALDPDDIPSWFVFAASPAVVTYIAFVVSKGLQALLDARDNNNGGGATRSAQGVGAKEGQPARRPKPWRLVLWQGISSAVSKVRKEVIFYSVLLGWFVVGLVGWYEDLLNTHEPLAWAVRTSTPTSSSTTSDWPRREAIFFTENLLELRVASAALAVGLAMFAARWLFERRKTPDDPSSPPRERLGPQKKRCSGPPGLGSQNPIFTLEPSQDPTRDRVVGIEERKTAVHGDVEDDSGGTGNGNNTTTGDAPHGQIDPPPHVAPPTAASGEGKHSNNRVFLCSRSRVPSLLVGWGLGFWATSVVYLLAAAWPEGTWKTAPVYVMVLGCVVVPLVFCLGLFMIADANFLGPFLGRFLERPARFLNDSGSFAYWTMATMLRSAFVLWFWNGWAFLDSQKLNMF